MTCVVSCLNHQHKIFSIVNFDFTKNLMCAYCCYTDLILDRQLQARVFVLPQNALGKIIKNPNITYDKFTPDIGLSLNGGEFITKEIETRVYVGVPSTILVVFHRGATPLTQSFILIIPESDFHVSLFHPNDPARERNELKLSALNLSSSEQASTIFYVVPKQEGLLQIAIRGTFICDQRKFTFSKVFGIESALPFSTKIRVFQIKNYEYLAELTLNNERKNTFLDVTTSIMTNPSYETTTNANVVYPVFLPNTEIKTSFKFRANLDEKPTNKCGEFSIAWRLEQSDFYSCTIDQRIKLKEPLVIPALFKFEITKCPAEAKLLNEFAITVCTTNITDDSIIVNAQIDSSEAHGLISKTAHESLEFQPHETKELEFKLVSIREGHASLPTLTFDLGNMTKIKYNPKNGILIIS